MLPLTWSHVGKFTRKGTGREGLTVRDSPGVLRSAGRQCAGAPWWRGIKRICKEVCC